MLILAPARSACAARLRAVIARMPLRAAVLTVTLLLLGAAPARAAFDVTAFEVTPANTTAGAHSDVTIATSFAPYAMGAVPDARAT